MFMTPDEIASLIGHDPAISPQKVLQDYLTANTTVRYAELKEHYSAYGIVITEQDMLRLLDDNLDFVFVEGKDKDGQYWQATLQEGYQNNPGPQENWLMGPEFDDEDQNTAFDQESGYEQPGFGESPLDTQGFPAPAQLDDQPGFDGPADEPMDPSNNMLQEPPQPGSIPQNGVDGVAQDEVPPAQSLPVPDLVAQMMEPFDEIGELDNQAGFAQVGQISAPTSAVEQPTQQSVQPMPNQLRRPAGGRQFTQPTQMPMPQPEPFGSDGDNFTIDPLLNSARKGGMIQNEPTKDRVQESIRQGSPEHRILTGRQIRDNVLAERRAAQ